MPSIREEKEMPIKYYRGLLDKYLEEQNCDHWEHFPEVMWGLKFEMDCGESFEKYKVNCGLDYEETHSRRDRIRNDLYILEHAPVQIVGNYVFSYWRYLTHWTMGGDNFDEDFLRRSLQILIYLLNEELKDTDSKE